MSPNIEDQEDPYLIFANDVFVMKELLSYATNICCDIAIPDQYINHFMDTRKT